MSSLFSKLDTLDVRGNSFSGSIPASLFMIRSLRILNMESNQFSGSLEIGNISSPSKLEILTLGANRFDGPIPGFLWKLARVHKLSLAYLNTSTVVDLSLFSRRLTSLGYLDLSGITLKINSILYFPSIQILALSSCGISEFPVFLQNQTSLSQLDISSNQFEGQVPEWLWSLPELWKVNISHNSFTGFAGSADVIQRHGVTELLDISSNSFQNSFPLLPNSTVYFLGSNNRFSGEIPRSICQLLDLNILVLSNNNFSGSIPRCFKNFSTSLWVLHLQNNSLSGVLPEESISVELTSLDVGHNKLSGRLPKSLANCTDLEFLNMEDNKFNDTFPSWLRSFPRLEILVLRSNEFHGPISYPGAKLRIFDISRNHFNGVLPSDYFDGWTAISTVEDIQDSLFYQHEEFYHKLVALVSKGLDVELVWSGFAIYKVVDVSGNRFEGDIPESIVLLKGLILLNMSNNAFTGPIPKSLANLSNLQSLDLSQNKLSGRIPPELGKLTFLARMNFSHNKLEGPIPQGTQIQSQDSSSFEENSGLCGIPLQETCGGKEEETKKQAEVEEKEEEEEEEEVISWIAAAIGYLTGVFCGLTIAHILASSSKLEWFFIKIFCSST